LAGGTRGNNNPTKKALEEAKRMFGSEHRVSIVLSLGSGSSRPITLHNGMKDEFRQILDDLAQSGEETAEELSHRFENSSFYHRFSVDLGLDNLSITEWTREDIGTTTTHTKVYIEKISLSLSAVAELLMKNEGCVTLGQLSKSSNTSLEASSFNSAQVDVKPGMAKPIPRLSPFFIERHDVFKFME
jgi:hypothetical protein